jgi:hypothetical protein
MKTMIKFLGFGIFSILISTSVIAQHNQKTSVEKPAKTDTVHNNNRTTGVTKEPVDKLDESLLKAADAAEKAASKMKNVVENKAGKLAKASQPYLESLMVATTGLLDKLTAELDRIGSEKPAAKTEKPLSQSEKPAAKADKSTSKTVR